MKTRRIEVRLSETENMRFEFLKGKFKLNNSELFQKMLSEFFNKYEVDDKPSDEKFKEEIHEIYILLKEKNELV